MALLYWGSGEPVGGTANNGDLDSWFNGEPLGLLLGTNQDVTAVGAIASEEAFGTAVVAGPITVSGIASLEAFGTPQLNGLLEVTGIASEEAFGTALLTLFLLPTGIASEEAFGTLLLDQILILTPTGITSEEAFGTPVVAGPITTSGVASEEAFGTAVVAGPVTSTGIASGTAFGVPVVAGPITVTGIDSEEAFGTAVMGVHQTIDLSSVGSPPVGAGIASEEAFGTATVRHVVRVFPTAIDSAEAFGTATVSGGAKAIIINGGIYEGAMGIPALLGGNQNLEIFVGNYNRADTNYIEQTLKISFQTLGKSTAEFTLYDSTGTWAPSLGMKILCKEYGRTLFAGCLHTIRAERVMSTASEIFYHCTALDKSSILNRRVVKKNYTADQDAADVVRDIILNFLDGEGLSDAGVPATLGTLGTNLVLNLVTVSNAFDQIYNIIAAQWWVDVQGVIYFKTLDDAPDAPITITEDSRNWRNLTVESTLEDYRNREYVKTNLNVLPGSSENPGDGTPTRTESWIVQQAYAQAAGFITGAGKLDYNVSRVRSIRLDGVEQPFMNGVLYGLTAETAFNLDKLWYYFPGSPYITPPGSSAGGPSPFPDPPVAGDEPVLGQLVEIDYLPENYTAVLQTNPALLPEVPVGVFNPAGTDLGTCGSGIYEFVDQVTDIQYQEDLDAIAAGILQRSGVIPFKMSFETDQPGLMPGQKLSVHLPAMLLQESGGPTNLFITSVSGGSLAANLGRNVKNVGPDSTFRWNVTASNQRNYGDYIKWYQRLVLRSNLALPITQFEEATFVLAPGGNLSSGTNLTNPYIVGRSGKLTECLLAASVPPEDQDLVIDILLSSGDSIFSSFKAVLPAGETSIVRVTEFSNDPLYLTKDELLNVTATYSVLGPSPTAASSVTVKLRWAI